jgi:hypothetical protein
VFSSCCLDCESFGTPSEPRCFDEETILGTPSEQRCCVEEEKSLGTPSEQRCFDEEKKSLGTPSEQRCFDEEKIRSDEMRVEPYSASPPLSKPPSCCAPV